MKKDTIWQAKYRQCFAHGDPKGEIYTEHVLGPQDLREAISYIHDKQRAMSIRGNACTRVEIIDMTRIASADW